MKAHERCKVENKQGEQYSWNKKQNLKKSFLDQYKEIKDESYQQFRSYSRMSFRRQQLEKKLYNNWLCDLCLKSTKPAARKL